MKIYVVDSVVVINNTFENKIFIYDRLNRLEYEINEDTFDIIRDIKCNDYTKKDLIKMYPEDFILKLFDMNIITEVKQQNINNVKKLSKYNNARIFVEVTEQCNLKCKHCYGSFECLKKKKLDIETLKKIIKNGSKAGVYQFDITGGEPFLYPNLEDLLSFAYDNGMLVRIFTNLTLYNDKFKNMILKYGVKDIVTSIDSSDSIGHDEFRGKSGSFQNTLNAIKDLQKENVSITLNTMIGNHNKSKIEDLLKFIENLNVKSVLDVIVPEGRAKELKEDIIDSSNLIKSIYKKYSSKINRDAIKVSCGIGNRFIYIKSDGNIYICPSLIMEEYKIGRVDNYDTKKIWKKMNEKFSYLECCKKNQNCKNCTGGCRARALKLNKNINARDDVYCIINEAGENNA